MQYPTTHVQKSAHCTCPPAQNFEQSSGDVRPSLSVSDSERWWPDSAKYPSSGEQAIESPALIRSWFSSSAPLADGGSFSAFTGVPPGSNTGGNCLQDPSDDGISAHVDTLTFTVPGFYLNWDLGFARTFVERFSGDRLSVGGLLPKRFNGYPECYALVCGDGGPSEGINLGWVGVSYPNDHQRGHWCFHLTGAGCVLVGHQGMWRLSLQAPHLHARITRCDCAVDDLHGRYSSYEWAESQYAMGGFDNPRGGRRPRVERYAGQTGDGVNLGRTLYVGRRGSGKMVRGYEKGKQLGEAESPWFRNEGEFRSKDRNLSWAMVAFPGEYMAAAYPRAYAWYLERGDAVRGVVDQARESFRVVREKARITADRLMRHGRQQVGRLVNYLRDVCKMDYCQVVESLAGRPGRYPVGLMEPVVMERLRV